MGSYLHEHCGGERWRAVWQERHSGAETPDWPHSQGGSASGVSAVVKNKTRRAATGECSDTAASLSLSIIA